MTLLLVWSEQGVWITQHVSGNVHNNVYVVFGSNQDAGWMHLSICKSLSIVSQQAPRALHYFRCHCFLINLSLSLSLSLARSLSLSLFLSSKLCVPNVIMMC